MQFRLELHRSCVVISDFPGIAVGAIPAELAPYDLIVQQHRGPETEAAGTVRNFVCGRA